jgi:hypothetical protein
MDGKGDIAKALMSDIPVNHWRSWALLISA